LRTASQHIDRFITPSHFAANIHRQRGFDAPFVHLPYFVPPVELAPRRETDAPYFLFAGRLEKLKGVQTLIPIFQNYPQAKLLIAGNGSYKAHLHALARAHPNIEFLGQVSGAELHALYRNAIALIMPSLCYEAFPLVMVEAFQQQTPVIARNLGAMPEMIRDSGGGLIYATDNELVAALNRLLDNPSDRRELGQRGYAAYQEKWTPETHLQNYLALIEEIAGGKSK
jgi:glycosyltransferase involved in cell wall biosynthesis